MTSGCFVVPNLVDYDAARASFSWEAARHELSGLPGGSGLNIAHETIDRHASGPSRNRVALTWLSKSGTVSLRLSRGKALGGRGGSLRLDLDFV